MRSELLMSKWGWEGKPKKRFTKIHSKGGGVPAGGGESIFDQRLQGKMLCGSIRQLRDPLLPRRNAFESCPGKGRGAGSSNGSEMRASYFMQVDPVTMAEHVVAC